MPPLFVVGPEGDTSELVNYRVRGNYMIVDRLFAAAELRFGADKNQKRVRISARTGGRRRERGTSRTGRRREPDAPRPVEAAEGMMTSPLTGEPVAPMRLRPSRRVTRLSRKVLAGLGLAASVGVGGALVYALQTRHGGDQGKN
jgi:hypothetical protein